MRKLTNGARRLAVSQAAANGRIEGHVASAEHRADMEAVAAGTMTTEQARKRSRERVRFDQWKALALKGGG